MSRQREITQEVLCTRINEIMKDGHMNKSAVARAAGFTPNLFYSMLTGRKIIRAEHIDPICKALHVTPNELYSGDGNGDLYRVESFDEGCTEPKVTLRRIKDGTIFDVEAPALFLTPAGVQLLWPREVNRFCSTLEQAV